MQNTVLSGTINNAIITLGNIDDSGKGRHFVSRFIKDGLVKIEGHGVVLLKKETLDASLPSMIGTPVIIRHQDVTKKNADKLRCGTISNAYFNEPDGWYYCEGIIWDEDAQELIENQGWSVSCSYDFLSYNDEGGVENNIPYDKEFTNLNFTHLAIVDNPRYERANIVFNSKDEEKGKWVTIKGNHIFIPDGKTLDEVIKEKGWGDKENKQSDTKDKHGFKKDKDSGYYMKDLSDGTSVYVEKKEGGQGEKEPFYLEATHFDKDGKEIAKKQYHYDSMEGMFGKIDKDFVSKGKQSGAGKDIKAREETISKIEKTTQKLIDIVKDLPESERGVLLDTINTNLKSINILKSKTDNSKEQDMALLEEIKKLITKIENSKENEMEIDEKIENETVDKRKLIDEVAGIMKSAGCDDEDIRTAIGKMEKIGYDKSEAGSADNKKVKNEEPDKKDDKKVGNEDEKDEKEVKDLKDDMKKDVDNKCKNSKEKSTFDKINAIYNSIKLIKEESKYTSRQEKLDAAKEYFS